MAEAVRAESEKIGVPMCFAVTDEHGNLQYFKKMPGALLISTSIAIDKAYTAASLKMSTAELAPLAACDGPLYGINTHDSRLIIFGGGQLLKKDGVIIGAIGVSGGSVEEDDQCGDKAVEVFNNRV
jgi:cob(I)alamin adenosyltransferase